MEEQHAQAVLDRLRSNRQIVFFAAATVLAMLLSGVLGLYFLQGVVDVANKPSWLNAFDVLVTGLVIGAGTKPLHDLIKRLERRKRTPIRSCSRNRRRSHSGCGRRSVAPRGPKRIKGLGNGLVVSWERSIRGTVGRSPQTGCPISAMDVAAPVARLLGELL